MARPGTCGGVWAVASRAAGYFIFGAALSGTAHAGPDTGPLSSESIEISVSVAPSYRLLANKDQSQTGSVAMAGPGGLCIAASGQPMPLPVMLLWPTALEAAGIEHRPEGAQLPPCGPTARSFGTVNDHGDRSPIGLLIVRPE